VKKDKNFTKGDSMVKCERCEGFMVRDSIYHIEGQFLEIEMARCLNCGHTVDLTLARINQNKKAWAQTKEERVLV